MFVLEVLNRLAPVRIKSLALDNDLPLAELGFDHGEIFTLDGPTERAIIASAKTPERKQEAYDFLRAAGALALTLRRS